MVHCTVAFNTNNYSSIGAVSSSGVFYSQNSILAGNATNDFSGVLTSEGYNLIQNTNGCAIAGDETGNIYNQDPKLGPLADYGGPTPTMPLLAGSPALDGGSSSGCAETDQRGRVRPYGAACDIGAFESSPPYVIRGKVMGFTLSEEVAMLCGTGSTTTEHRGGYSLEGLAAGTHTVTPSSANYHFVPGSTVLTVGPDHVDVNFNAYRWNALSVEGVADGLLHLIYAGTNGDSVRTLASDNFTDWTTISTNTVPPTNLFDIFEPTSQPWRFYRTVKP